MAKRRRSGPPIRIPYLRRVRRFILLLLMLTAGTGTGLYLRGKVVSVSDGDTITVFTEGGSLQRIRLYGVDCPETRQPGGEAAASFTSGLALFQEASYTTMDTDQYGRAVALVTLPGGRLLNQELIAGGHAWVYRNYCKAPVCASWMVLEAKARSERRGLWRQGDPVPPWKWRAANRR